MSETASAVPDGPLLGHPQGMLALRICGTERDGQVVRLKSPKVTIGASAGCVLRLRSPGVGPLHCVILRGPQRTIVHRYLPDTRLNGAGFDEASLQVGDRLSIGPLEFEVIDEPESGNAQIEAKLTDEPTAADADDKSHTERRNPTKPGRRTLDKDRQELDELRHSLEEQGRNLNGLRDSLKSAEARLDVDRTSLQTERQTLAAQCEMLVKEHASMEAAQQELEANRNQLAVEHEELHKARSKWEAERQQSCAHEPNTQSKLVQESDDREQRIVERDAQLQRDIAQFDQQQEEFAAARAQWENASASREAEFAQRLESLERRLADMDQERRQIAKQNAQLQQERQRFENELAKSQKRPLPPHDDAGDEAPHPVPSAVADDQHAATEANPAEAESSHAGQEDDDELFARLRALALLKEPAETESTAQTSHPEASDPVPDAQSPSASSERLAKEQLMPANPALPTGQEEHHEDEESIDDYMSRLLQRVRGMAADSETESTPVKPADTASPEPVMGDESSASVSPARDLPSSAGQPAKPKPPKLSKLEPRKAAPEKPIDLAAMRELANITARSAIASHHERRRASFAVQKIGLAGAGLVMSLFLLLWSAFGSLFFYGGLVGLIASMMFLVQAKVLRQYVRGLRQKASRRRAGPVEATPRAATTDSESQGRAEASNDA